MLLNQATTVIISKTILHNLVASGDTFGESGEMHTEEIEITT